VGLQGNYDDHTHGGDVGRQQTFSTAGTITAPAVIRI